MFHDWACGLEEMVTHFKENTNEQLEEGVIKAEAAVRCGGHALNIASNKLSNMCVLQVTSISDFIARGQR